MPLRRLALRLLAFLAIGCALPAGRAEAGVIVIGSPAWERLQKLSVAAKPAAKQPPAELEADRPWRRSPSLGAAGRGMPIVLSRRDDGPAAAFDNARPEHHPTLRHAERHPLRPSPPNPAGIFRPPEPAPATADVA